MTIVKIGDENLEGVSGGVLVEVPARGGDTDYVFAMRKRMDSLRQFTAL